MPLTELTRDQVDIAGIRINNLTQKTFIDAVDTCIKIKKPTRIATVNLDFLYQACNNPKIKSNLDKADIRTADGMPILWLSSLKKKPLKERVTGSDSFIPMLELANKNHLKVFILGGKNGSVDKGIKKINTDFPNVTAAGYEPPFAPIDQYDNDAIIRQINHFQPDILFVALGFPKQEFWQEQFGSRINVPVSIGCGATLDFFLGEVKRAPRAMQKSGLEWIHRLTQEPGRMFKRYSKNGLFLINLYLKEFFSNRSNG